MSDDWKQIRTSYPGKIVEFNPATQVAKVQVARERYVDNLVALNVKEDSPILVDVPVHFPQGGGYSLTFPIVAGDNCLVMFAERGYSHWLYKGLMQIGLFSNGIPKSDFHRRFDVNDSFALVGFNPIPAAIPNFQPASVELRNADRSERFTMLPGGTIEVRAATLVDVVAPTMRLTGNLDVVGNVTVSGTIDAQGIIKSLADVFAKTVSLFGHKHTSTAPGTPTTVPIP